VTDRPGGTADQPDGRTDGPGEPDAGRGSAGTPPAGLQAYPGQGGMSDQGGMSGRSSSAAGRASSPPHPPGPGPGTSATGGPAAADPEEEWPDDAGPAGGASGPTGMELIERQLGGTIIEEIDES
jgi:hypothetical protein